MDTELVGSAKFTFKFLLPVKKLNLIFKIDRLFGISNSIKHYKILLVDLLDLLMSYLKIKGSIKPKGTLVVLGYTDLGASGNLSESVDQALVLFVLRTPGFHVAETLGSFEFPVSVLDDKVCFFELGSSLYV